MSLAQILYPPPTPQGMEEWFQAHARHHQAIIFAMRETKGVSLDDLGLYPVNATDLDNWLELHQRMHTQMNSALGIPGTDLSGLDLKDKNLLDAWMFQHFLQHQGAGQLCGMAV